VDTSLLAFLGISALVIATPGPDTALTVRNALLGGRRAGIFTALGVSVGQIVWAIGTSVGLVALLLASEPVFQALKLLGAAYLLYLGIQSLRSAFLRSPLPGSVPAASGRTKFSGEGVSPGRDQRSRKPRDGRVLRKRAAAVLTEGAENVLDLGLDLSISGFVKRLAGGHGDVHQKPARIGETYARHSKDHPMLVVRRPS